MAGFNLTSYDAAFKTRYSKKFIDSMTYGPNRLYAMLKKSDNKFTGRTFNYVTKFASSQGGSATFSQAQTNMATAVSQQVQFALTRVRDYQMVSIDNETMLASKGDEGAFFSTAFAANDDVIKSNARRLNIALYRSGWGEIGVSASTSTTTITLTNKEDIVNFEIGQTCVGSTSQNAAVLNASGASATVTAVNRTLGTVTFNATMATICPAGSFLFIKGDRQDSATPTALKVAGLDAWLPPAGATATLHFGVNRTVDTRLAGLIFDGSASNLEETLIDAGLLAAREGAEPDFTVMNTKNYGDLLKSLGSKVNYVDVMTCGHVGFRAIELHLPTGTQKIIADRDCPVNVAYMLQSDTWEWCGLGGTGPGPLETADGSGRVTAASEDGIETRIGWYGQLACYAPGWNTRIKLA